MGFDRVSSFEGVYSELHTPAVAIGAAFALAAMALSTLLIFQHLRSYTKPEEQKWIIGILLMVPVYAGESVISLWNSKFSIFCDILRNCYEAYALYSFGCYLTACLGGEERVQNFLQSEARKDLGEHLIKEEKVNPHENGAYYFFCHPVHLGKDLYTIIKFGIVQYMILKTVCAFLSLILEVSGVYGDGEFKWYYGYPYIAVVINFSQMWALYCLVQFYNVTHDILKPIKPLAKFISFKAIVFATWWQGFGIAVICYCGILPKEGKIQNGIQDFLICIEMAVAAVAHIYVFSVEPYRYLPDSEYGEISSEQFKTKLNVGQDGKGEPAVVEQKETNIEAPGTSITESVQDVFVGGGEHVVKDVALTISQAIEPVEKGVNKIQETFHHISLGSEKERETKVDIEEHVKKNVVEGESESQESETKVDIEEHVTKNVVEGESETELERDNQNRYRPLDL